MAVAVTFGETMKSNVVSQTSTAVETDNVQYPAVNSVGATELVQPILMNDLVEYCLQMQPEVAAAKSDSSLCVSPLVTHVIDEKGNVVELALVDGRWAGLNVRVSSDGQRSGRARKSRHTESGQRKDEGVSETEQVTRGIRKCLDNGWAFRIYSDAGRTGEYPNNNPDLIRKLLKTKADRYSKIFNQTLLDETSMKRRTEAEIKSMLEYRNKKVKSILSGYVDESELYTPNGTGLDERTKRALRGRPKKRVFFRQGFTQLWDDLSHVHTILTSDRSRLCRCADLESAFLDAVSENQTRLLGLIEDLSSIDVSDPLKKGLTYFVASVNEYRLAEIQGHVFRGMIQTLESGKPHGHLYFWMERDRNGNVVVVEEYAEIARRIVNMYLGGDGAKSIATTLIRHGVHVRGKALTRKQILHMMNPEVLAGKSKFFGLLWNTYPAIITDPEILSDLRARREVKDKGIEYMRNPENWGDHVFSGLLRCHCGQRMAYLEPSQRQKAAGRGVGVYACKVAHRRAIGQTFQHANIREDILGEFFGELFRHNPQIISGHLARSLDQTGHLDRLGQRAILESELNKANELFVVAQQSAKKRAHEAAVGLGLPVDTSDFDGVVQHLCNSYLHEESQFIQELKSDLTRLQLDISKQKQSDGLLSSLGELKDWDQFDNLTRNRLMRTVVESIVVYPRVPAGRLVVKLHGIITCLPAVQMRRLSGRYSRLPTVEEWIRDMLEPPTLDDVSRYRMLNSKNMRPFYSYILHAQGLSDQYWLMMAEVWRDNPSLIRDRYVSRDRVLADFKRFGADVETYKAFDLAWADYMEWERERIISGVAKFKKRGTPLLKQKIVCVRTTNN